MTLFKGGFASQTTGGVCQGGESISQVNTYITTGVTDVGFTTQSLVKDVDGKTTVLQGYRP
jgi:hypothetical protein